MMERFIVVLGRSVGKVSEEAFVQVRPERQKGSWQTRWCSQSRHDPSRRDCPVKLHHLCVTAVGAVCAS